MPAPRTTQRWLLPVLVVVVSVTLGGGLLAREAYKRLEEDTDPGTVVTSGPAVSPQEQPGSPLVQLTADAAAHPQDEQIRILMQTYFDAINVRNYDRWKTTVTTARVQATSESEWRASYRTTRDGSMIVYRIDPAPDDRLQILVGFTSTQDPSNAPPDMPEPCIRWSLALPVVQQDGDWKVDVLPTNTTAEHARC